MSRFLYIAHANSGLVKIGVTSYPRSRAKQMARDFKSRGAQLSGMRFFPLFLAGQFERGHEAERAALSGLAAMGAPRPPSTREWFFRLDLELATILVRQCAQTFSAASRVKLKEMAAKREEKERASLWRRIQRDDRIAAQKLASAKERLDQR